MSLFSADALASAPVRTVPEPGKYMVEFVKAEETISKQKFTPGVHFEVVITDGPIQSNNSSPVGQHIFADWWKSKDPEKQGTFLGQMHGLTDAVEIDLSQFSGMSDEEFTAELFSMLIGRQVVATVDNEVYQGNAKAVIKRFSKA